MSAPLCLWCGVKRVRKTYGGRERCSRKGPGLSMWRNFCSRTCSGESAMAGLDPEKRQASTARMVALNRERTKQRVIRLIREVVGVAYRDGDPVTLAQLVRLAQISTAHGAHCQRVRQRQQRLKHGAMAA